MDTDCAIDSKTCIGPVADPIAVVEVGMTGVAVTDVRFVMAAAGAKQAGPAGMTIVFRIDMPAAQKVFLLLPVDTGRDLSQSTPIGIDNTMTMRNSARRRNAEQAKGSAARRPVVYAHV